MKRLSGLLTIIILSLFLIPFSVNASGSITVSPRSITLSPGGSGSFTISANNAAGRVDISSSNGSVATVSTSSQFLDNNSITVTVRAVNAGSATINVVIRDAATYDEEVLSGTIPVNVVVNAPAPTPTPTPTPTPSTNNNTNPKTNDTRSANTNLKKLEVEGHNLSTTDKTNYSLTVKNSVNKIKIVAEAADNKAKVSGAGEKELKVGDNVFQVVVTAENGTKKTYTITVTRKDDTYYLSDLDDAIAEAKENIVITLRDNDVLTKEHLNKIKKANKNAYFIRKENSKTLYSWMITSRNISNQDNISMNLSFISSNKAKFEKLTDYREGIYLNFSYHGNLPKNTILRIFVGDKYSDGDKLNLYYLDGDKNAINYIKQEVQVTNGYAEISIDHCSEYFLTKATISGDNVKVVDNDDNIIPIIVMILLLILIICVVVLIVIKNNSNNNEIIDEKEENEEKIEDTKTEEVSTNEIVNNSEEATEEVSEITEEITPEEEVVQEEEVKPTREPVRFKYQDEIPVPDEDVNAYQETPINPDQEESINSSQEEAVETI